MCITYDGQKDLYKLYADGEKVTSGSFAGDNPVNPIRWSHSLFLRLLVINAANSRAGGATYLGQDQDSVGGGFTKKQSWSGEITQFNVWDFALEEYSVENAAECRSDILGNIMRWEMDLWVTNDVKYIPVQL